MIEVFYKALKQLSQKPVDNVYIPKYERLRLAQEYFRVDNSWDESKHPRDDKGKFTSGDICDKINNKERKALELPKDEYSKVMHELNTNLSKEQRGKDTLTKCIGDYKYTVINKGFNEYTVINKEKI